jgi:aspartate aminotransferase
MSNQLKISQRAENTPPSPIRSLIGLANDAERRGVHVHKLNIGQPDLHSPQEFLDALHTFDHKTVAYDASPGNTTLLKQWTELLNRHYTLGLTQHNMVITSGSSEALTFVFSICCDVGDDILVFDPTYANYTGFASLAGVNLVPVECSFDSKFHLPQHSVVESKITQHTRAILVCNPNNPTGTTLTHDELHMLLQICEAHNLFLIVDEVYREFVYGNRKPTSALELSEKNPRVIVVDSISKRYSLCGARIGCIISHNTDVMKAANTLASTRVSAPTVEQVATAHMLETLDDTYLQRAVRVYARRNQTLVTALNSVPGVEVSKAEGGFYVLAKLPVENAENFAKFLLRDFSLNDETVFLAPASGFYTTPSAIGRSSVRIAFVLKCADIQRAVEIIRRGLEVYTALQPAL